jgi:hypothetical protein
MIRRKAGRPTIADLAERTRRKKAWRREQERRRKLDSQIEQGLVESITWGEAIARLGKLRAQMLVAAVRFPAAAFVLERIDAAPDGQFDIRQAMIDLLRSKLPLDKYMRDCIADELQMLMNPKMEKRRSIRAKVEVIKEALAEHERHGEKPEDAYAKIAQEFGHASGDALRKWMENHERLLDDK